MNNTVKLAVDRGITTEGSDFADALRVIGAEDPHRAAALGAPGAPLELQLAATVEAAGFTLESVRAWCRAFGVRDVDASLARTFGISCSPTLDVSAATAAAATRTSLADDGIDYDAALAWATKLGVRGPSAAIADYRARELEREMFGR